MSKNRFALMAVVVAICLSIFASSVLACTTIMVTPGASVDGSASVTQTCDAGGASYDIYKFPAQTYEAGSMVEVFAGPQSLGGMRLFEMDMLPTGNYIPQVSQTIGYIGGLFGMMNEYQVAAGETSLSGRRESRNTLGWFDISGLSHFGLQRAKTVREFIQIMGDLAVKYGFNEGVEGLVVADANEVWMFEVAGPGALWAPGDSEPGAYWVARRVPDGHVSANANNSVVGVIDFNDHDNFMYSSGILEFAQSMGWYNPASGKAFNWSMDFCNAVSYATCARRVWRVMCLAAPSLTSSLVETSLPFSVPVDKKLSIDDINKIQGDHYEGTIYDTSQGITAGPWNNPRRYRGTFRADGVTYAWQRSISQTQTEYSITTQSRAWLPNEVGGVVWFGATNPDATCYVPLYASVTELSAALGKDAGSHLEFSKKSYWWAVSMVSTYIDLKYEPMVAEVNIWKAKYEAPLLNNQSAIDNAALYLLARDRNAAINYLTEFCRNNVETVRDAWWELRDYLIFKYNIGFVTENGRVNTVSYPESWLRQVIALNEPDHY